MSKEVAEILIRGYLALRLPQSSFCWQGGEPTLMGLDFFRNVAELQTKYGTNGQIVANSLQTNGTLLTEEWCKFLTKYKFLVGISMDGPEEFHDHYRRNIAGQGSFQRVIAGINLCKEYGVEFNVLTLLTERNVENSDILFAFLVEHGIRYMQFIPCFEKDNDGIASYSITHEQYGHFLCRLFDLWLAHGFDKVSIRLFDSLLSYLLNGNQSICTFQKRCGDYVVVEHDGSVYACDFFVEPQWKLGNLLETPIDQLAFSEKKRQFADAKYDVSSTCFVCRHFNLCRGGCLKERIFLNCDYKGQSYFCQSYKRFFDYTVPKLMQLLPKIAGRHNV